MKALLHLPARRARLTGIAVCIVTVVGGSGVALAAVGGGGSIDSCYGKATGALRVIDPTASQCRDGETSLAWAQTPAQGPKGEIGSAGARGDAGDQGPQGPKGQTGVIGYQGSVGPQGPVGRPGSHGYVLAWGELHDLPPLGAVVAIARCPAGKTIVGGGFTLENADVEESTYDPYLTGWQVTARGGATGGQFTPIAICGNPA
jgi:hypothetical protein